MVEQPYYEAETKSNAHTPRYRGLADTISEYGIRRREKANLRYGDITDDSHTHIEIGSWARGPLLYLEKRDGDGDVGPPTLSNTLVKTVVRAGFTPWGFRPETESGVTGRERTGRWMWYLRPVEDVTDEESEVYDSVYAIKTPEGELEYLRNDSGNLVTFDDRENAEAVINDSEVIVEVSG